jgi:hypothetical protein
LLKRYLGWLCATGAGGAGAVWGLGLARFLALEAHVPFFYSSGGTALIAFLAGAASLVVWRMQVRQGLSPCSTALRLSPLLIPLVDLFLGGVQPWRGPVLLLGSLFVTIVASLHRSLPSWVYSLWTVVLPLALYLPDVAPWVGRADTFEFQVVAPHLGVAHPSGYPLYVLLGKLFSLLPIGSVAWRVNLSSAVCAALAACALYQAVKEDYASSASPIPVLASLTLAFSPTLWSRSVEAEVYALNALVVALALWVAVRWTQGTLDAERALPLLGLLTGVGIASHLTLGALLFLVAPLALTVRPRPSRRAWAAAVGLFVAGLALYLYIPLRWPALNNGEAMSLARFLAFATNAESGGALRPLAFLQDPARWDIALRLMRMQVGWGGLALAVVGLIVVCRRRWPLALGTALASAVWVWFNLSFYVAEPDYSAFLIPAHVVIIFWLGMGLGWLLDLVQRKAVALLPAFLAATTLLPLSRIWLTGPSLDTVQERADDAWGRYVLTLPIEPDAVILADSEKFPPLYYLQQVEGLRPDLDLVMRFDEAGYWEELGARLAVGQTVYLARYLPHLEGYLLRSLGPLVEVGMSPLVELPSDAVPVRTTFGNEAELLAFKLQGDPLERSLWHLTLYWRAVVEPQNDLQVRLRLVDQAGAALWSSDGVRPVEGLYPTNAWSSGAVVSDYHEVTLPPWLPSGEYRLEVGLFPPFDDAGLEVDAEATAWLSLSTLEVDLPSDPLLPLPYQQRHCFDGGECLTGYNLVGEAPAGAPFTVDLSWRRVETDAQVRLAWVDMSGSEIAVAVFPLAAGVLHSHRTITAPQTAGDYQLRVGLVDETARCGWLAPSTSDCPLAEVEVAPMQEGLANFGDLMLLLDAQVGETNAQPGQVVPVALRWRALQAMKGDYTVFVQLIGPDGQLHGQVDMWPVHGSRPTSQWAPGEEVDDPYEVQLSLDAPPGNYQVAVGWYLLATMQRLPILDTSDRPIGDFFIAGEFSVGG